MDSDSISKIFLIEFTYHHDKWPSIDKDMFERITAITLSTLNWARPATISVLFTDDSYVKKLNQTYRKQNKPTNVLSFVGYDQNLLHILPNTENIPLGDIIFALETIQNEAIDQKKSFKDHLQHLFLHGLLHLLGFDHEVDTDAEIMENLEIDILSTLLIPNPYEVI